MDAMGLFSVQEMLVVLLVALVLFGPKKLPELARTMGRAISEFRRAQNELKATLQHHMSELEKESESVRDLTRSFNNDIYTNYYDSRSYDSPAIEASTTSASATQGAQSDSPVEANEGSLAVNGTVARGAPEVHSATSPVES
jgi:TatA/E family protein of Tat protein translocase